MNCECVAIKIGPTGVFDYVGRPSLNLSSYVVGPASSTDEALARFDGTTGKLIQNSGTTLSDAGALIVPASVDSPQIFTDNISDTGAGLVDIKGVLFATNALGVSTTRNPDNFTLNSSTSTDNAAVRFVGTGGKTVENSLLIIGDTGNVTGVVDLTMTGNLNSRDPDDLAKGPASATDNAVSRFDGTGGKTLQNSVVLVSDTGAVTGVTTIVASSTIQGTIITGTTGVVTPSVQTDIISENTAGVGVTADGVLLKDGLVGIGYGGTGQTAQTAAFDALAPTTTKGDVIVSNGSDNIRLAVGTDAFVFQADSTTASGTKWATVSTSGIGSKAVTFSRFQDIDTDKLVGRDTAGTGACEEIGVDGSVVFNGFGFIGRAALTGDVTATAGSNATTIANDAVTDAKLRNSAALSFVCRTANSSGDPGDLAMSAEGHSAQRWGSTLVSIANPATIYASSTTTVNNTTTFTDAAGLTFTFDAATIWQFRYVIRYTSPATPDIKFRIEVSGTAPDAIMWGTVGDRGTATYTSTTAAGDAGFIILTSGSNGMIVIEGLIDTAAGTATPHVEFAQNTATVADTSVLIRSFGSATRIA